MITAYNRQVGRQAGEPTLPRPSEPTETTDLPWKRPFDLYCIILSLPLVLPVMILVVIWIKLISPGPALFRQERVGRDGKRFMLYKFRSMKFNADNSCHEAHLRNLVDYDRPMIKLDLLADHRLIAGGRFLRAAGLDELPQLLNVIKGEMSLVGPRPCLPQEYHFFSLKQRERFQLLPGLTGIWQVSGKNQSSFNEMNLMDIHYVRQVSIPLDLKIMLRTPSVLLFQVRETVLHKRSGHRAMA
jgi:lipopolysaccharide/colanic/teichoic acid biosynthesis glycosyltransferase